MPRNTSVILGEHFSKFVDGKIQSGRFETDADILKQIGSSSSEAVRMSYRQIELNKR